MKTIFLPQQKKLMAKVMSRDVLHYRKLTDVSVEDKDKPRDPPPALDLELMAKGVILKL